MVAVGVIVLTVSKMMNKQNDESEVNDGGVGMWMKYPPYDTTESVTLTLNQQRAKTWLDRQHKDITRLGLNSRTANGPDNTCQTEHR